MTASKAIRVINEQGALLVFPVNNRPEPRSLWSEFYPRRAMRWEWDESGDDGVAALWRLMKRLSEGRDVVYSKWYQGRATFFSRELFKAMLAVLKRDVQAPLAPAPRLVLETLESDSPLSTKQLKALTDLQGRDNEAVYNRAMKELFSRGLIVACGEFDDGSFPSLAVGATQLIFEDIWNEAAEILLPDAQALIDQHFPEGSMFRRYFDKVASPGRFSSAATTGVSGVSRGNGNGHSILRERK